MGMRWLLVFWVFWMGAWGSVRAQRADPEPGVSHALALQRASMVGALRYDLALRIPESREEAIRGRNRIQVELREAGRPLVLDFAPDRVGELGVRVNGVAVVCGVGQGHVVVPAEALRPGPNEVEVTFIAGEGPLHRRDDLLYSLFVPARAREAFPVLDQPDLKARWSLSLEVPGHWQAVSNAPERVGAEGLREGNRREVRFEETEPLSAYGFAFAAGVLHVETAVRKGRVMRLFHREEDAAKVVRNRDAIGDQLAEALRFMEEYTGMGYPWGKLDCVLIPAMQFGGMEHAGCAFFNASALWLEENATPTQRLARASLIAHEIAHMWFGNLVTMRWFDDVWLKEVFANFLADRIVEPQFPGLNHEVRFFLEHHPPAYAVERSAGTHPIRQRLENLTQAGGMYGPIIYEKAPVLFRHWEERMGAGPFREGLRDYLRKYRFGNASWGDLVETLAARCAFDVREWSRVWVEEAGRPVVRAEVEVEGGRVARFRLMQRDLRGEGRIWPQEMHVVLGGGGGVRRMRVWMDEAVKEVAEAVGMEAPEWVLPDGEGWAYAGVELDALSREAFCRTVGSVEDGRVRARVWMTLWEAVLSGELSAGRFVEALVEALPKESENGVVVRGLEWLGAAWARFLSQEERGAWSGRLEAFLRSGMERAASPGEKALWWRSFREMALSTDAVDWMQRVWAREEGIPGLRLSEADECALALELAVRRGSGGRAIVETQRERIGDAERRARFEFLVPVACGDGQERAEWMESLARWERRKREPWVVEGLSILHHPLREVEAEALVQRSLQMLWEVQRTGDLFFPKRWMEASLRGHRSTAVAREVLRFLQTLPDDYPASLRRVILQASDELLRAAER
jgi:aminopeptidase N